MIAETTAERFLDGFDSPEGPAFDRSGNLFFVNWLSSTIVRHTPAGETSEWFNTGGIPAGLAFHANGDLYVADEGDELHGVLRVGADRRSVVVAANYAGQPLNGANDLVFDARGVLYFSDPWRSSLANPIGGFYRLFPDGKLERLDSGLAFPNGVGLAPDGSAVYLAETGPNRILRYSIAADGRVGEREVFHQLQGGVGPDGMALDVDGRLYVAQFGGGCVNVISPAGALVESIPIPAPNVTNCAFGGPDRRTLVVTEVASGSLYRLRVRVGGVALFG